MKKCIVLMAVLAMAVGANAASINWGINAAAGQEYLFESDGTTLIAVGMLVELVYLGADGIAGTGDDSVWATSSVGTGTGKVQTPGEFVQAATGYTFGTDFTTGDSFGIRFWNTADTSGQYGWIGWDGVSEATASSWAITATDNLGSDSFSTGIAGTTSTVAPVPEPGTIALAIAGLGAVIARRRKNRK